MIVISVSLSYKQCLLTRKLCLICIVENSQLQKDIVERIKSRPREKDRLFKGTQNKIAVWIKNEWSETMH